MEPFRPLVDRAVALWCDRHGPAAPLDRQAKAYLIGGLMARVPSRERGRPVQWRTLFDLTQRLAASLADVFLGNRRNLYLPDLAPGLAEDEQAPSGPEAPPTAVEQS